MLLTLLLLSYQTFCCEVKVLNSCRDNFTKNISKSRTKRILRRVNRRPNLKLKLDSVYSKVKVNSAHTELFKRILSIPYVKDQYNLCEKDESNVKQYCYKKTLSSYIYYGYGADHLDATATIILLSKLSDSEKANYVGSLSSYARKIKLLRISYLKNQKEISNHSPLSSKKYLKKYGKLKKLTPRQNTLLKYNYSQLKAMGKIMQTFEKRILALSSGLFFDYDGDGENDETYVLDEAEKYRMSVKLLKLELEKKSHSGKIFANLKPDFHDLLVSSNELGLVSDKDLETMIELPFLYEEKKSPWKVAGEITWAIGKGIVMAIPGINLYSIIPIVLVDSFRNSREQRDETSDLHLFTF